MQRGRVSLVEINRVIPNFAQKVNFNGLSAQLGVTGQVRLPLVILVYHSIRGCETNILIPTLFVYHILFNTYVEYGKSLHSHIAKKRTKF